jgi:hypothetical protein
VTLATYKDLCLDAGDPRRLGDFWAGALGLELERCGEDSNGDYVLRGPTDAHTIWVNAVPEPRSVKHRMHLDVNTESVQRLVDLGATVLDGDSFPWTLMADPEGGELCAFVRQGEIGRRLHEIVVDTADDPAHAQRIATWWADVLGADAGAEEGVGFVENIPGAPFESIVFVPVPEPKTVKNRVHLDVTTPDLDELVAVGATVLRPQGGDIRWTVLADPDGNEFCAFVD